MTEGHRRLGRIGISRHVIDTQPDIARITLRGCIVVRAEMHYASDSIEYVVIHDAFEVVSPGMIPPRYEAVIDKGDRKWVKQS